MTFDLLVWYSNPALNVLAPFNVCWEKGRRVGRKEEVGERERGREREREARGKRERGREREIGGRYTNDGCTYPGDPRWGHIDVQQLCVGDEGYTSRCRRGFRGEQVRQV